MGRKLEKKRQFYFLYRKFPVRMQKRLVFSFFVISLAFLLLIGRIIYINAAKGETYGKIVMGRQVYQKFNMPYKRGSITDRNGKKLAYSKEIYNLILDVKDLLSDRECVAPTIQVLENEFGLRGEELWKTINDKKKKESHYEIVLGDMSYAQVQKLRAILEDKKTYPSVRGLWLERAYRRIYPYGVLASHLIGFIFPDSHVKIGIEGLYQDLLCGTNGCEYGYFGTDTGARQTIKKPKNGYDLELTLDITLEEIVSRHIREFNEEHAGKYRENEGGSKNTAVMILDPDSGEILAEASYPDFDPNSPRDLSCAYTKEQIGAMKNEQAALDGLWQNFCVSDSFEPGSTFKPFTIAAGLESGSITGDETYLCEGSLTVDDTEIFCHKKDGHGILTVEGALANSCNVALMQIAKAIGPVNFTRYQHIFGFGDYTGIDLPGEIDTSGLLIGTKSMRPIELSTNSFGQGFNVTMTQMGAAFCSLINGGNYFRPHVVRQIRDENGNVIDTKEPLLVKKTVSSKTSEMMKGYLRAVMTYGTGKSAGIEGYDVGGKTGTAEKLMREDSTVVRDKVNYLLSFIGYVPQDHPKVVVYVLVDEPNAERQDLSQYVLELSKSIMEEVFPYLHIKKVAETEQYAEE